MIVLGITGAIASGKSTVASMFANAGVPVFNADAVVHQFYRSNPAAVIAAFPTSVADGAIDRRRLAGIVESDPSAIAQLEAIVLPVVREAAKEFLTHARGQGVVLAVLEIPLMFETGSDVLCDKILVTSAPEEVREKRIADRGTMSAELYRRLRDRQMPDDEKLALADYIVDTDTDLDEVRRRIDAIVGELRSQSGRS
jgi:dephospho-CoA kinase